MIYSKHNFYIFYIFLAKPFKVSKIEKILIKYSGFRDTEIDFNNITNINNQINAMFYYLSNETKSRFVSITVLEL